MRREENLGSLHVLVLLGFLLVVRGVSTFSLYDHDIHRTTTKHTHVYPFVLETHQKKQAHVTCPISFFREDQVFEISGNSIKARVGFGQMILEKT